MKTKRDGIFSIIVMTLTLAILACSLSPSTILFGTPTPTATATFTQTPSPTPTMTPEPINIKVISSLPMAGGNLQTEAIVNAEKLRLSQSNYSACNGRYTISFEAWDDADTDTQRWSPDREAENAEFAAADPSVIAYLATFNSGAALVSIPITNQAGPLVMISPSNTNPTLTKLDTTTLENLAKLYPSGTRNYARVTTADDVQGNVAARFIQSRLNAETVYILDDGDIYGSILADSFETTAEEIGLTVLGRESINPNDRDYRLIMNNIAESNNGHPPDVIYVSMVYNNNAAQVLKDKIAVMGDNTKVRFVGPDGLFVQDFLNEAGTENAQGVFVSSIGLDFKEFPAKGQQFLLEYEAEYKNEADYYAIYGYEVMSVLLQAIENICMEGGDATNRETVRAAVFAITEFSGVLGTWSFDENGDTSLTDMTFYEVQDGEFISDGSYR